MADGFDIDAFLASDAKGKRKAPPKAPDRSQPKPPGGDFDVDSFLAGGGKPVTSLDPEYFGAPSPFLKKPMGSTDESWGGMGAAVARSGVSFVPGAGPLSDVISAGIMRAMRPTGVALTPQAREEALVAGLPVREPQAAPTALEEYRSIRDERHELEDVGAELNPWSSRLGAGLGILSTAIATRGLGAAPGAGRALATGGRAALKQSMKLGALLGGAQALAEGEADMTRGEVLPAAVETTVGGVTGGVGGAFGHALTQWTPALLRRTAQALRESAIKQGRNALLSGADSLSTREVSAEAVEEALRSGSIRPLGGVSGTERRLTQAAADTGRTYGEILEQLERGGVQGPEAAALADEMMARGASLERATSGVSPGLVSPWRETAQNIRASVPEGPSVLTQSLRRIRTPARLPLSQAETTKRTLQEAARYGRREETPLNEQRREIASVLRRAIEDEVEAAGQAAPEGSDVRTMADAFAPVKQRLSRLIEAREAAGRGARAEGRRPSVGLKDMATATAMGGGTPGGAALTALGSSLIRGRGPSTLASSAYGGSRALQSLANQATRGLISGELPPAIAAMGALGLGDGVLQSLEEPIEQQRARALAEALRRRREAP